MKRATMLLFLCVIAACIAAIGGAGPAAGAADPIKVLKQEKLKMAEEWKQAFEFRTKAGIQIEDEEFKVAVALRDAQLDLAENKKQRVKALTEFRDRTKSVYETAEVLTNQKGPHVPSVPEARIRLL